MNRIFWNLIHQKFGQDFRILKIESQIKKPAFSRFQSFFYKSGFILFTQNFICLQKEFIEIAVRSPVFDV